MKNKTLIFIRALFSLFGFVMLAAWIYFCLTEGDILGLMPLFVMGLISFSVGFIPFSLWIRKRNIKSTLQRNGRIIWAKFTSVEYNTLLSVDGQSPFIIYCQWIDPLRTDKLYVYKSDNIWFDPRNFIKGDTIKVYIDKNNPKRYYVDLSFLSEAH